MRRFYVKYSKMFRITLQYLWYFICEKIATQMAEKCKEIFPARILVYGVGIRITVLVNR